MREPPGPTKRAVGKANPAIIAFSAESIPKGLQQVPLRASHARVPSAAPALPPLAR